MFRLTGRRRGLLVAGLALAALSIAAFGACGDDDNGNSGNGGNGGNGAAPTQPPAANGGGELDYGSLSGNIRIDGSSTVFPITEAVAEEFRSVAPGVRVNVAFSGTGGGFEKFCRGETQFSNASRPIKDSELEACAANNINDVVELQVAIDALTVMVHPNNDFVDCLTVQQLHDIFTRKVTRWSEVDPSWPDSTMVLFFPGTDSGTFDYFVEAIIEGVDKEANHTGDGTPSEDDNILAQGIAGDTNAIGYFGFAYFVEAGQSLKDVAVDGGNGCVEPSLETALDGTYVPLSRPLFIYTRESFLRDNPEMLGFAKFFLDNSEELVVDVGYVPLPPDLLARQQAKLEPFLPR